MSLQQFSTRRGQPSSVPPTRHDVLRSPGQPLDKESRAFFEPRFGHEFSKVRIHTDAQAAESARALNAIAYTVGHDMVFGGNQYRPATKTGRLLLAHELAHVVQQSKRQPAASESFLEQEASQTALKVASGARVSVGASAAPSSVLFERRRIRGHEYLFGDVVLNVKASTDVRRHGVLLPGPDQHHIGVIPSGHRLGYEVGYATPDDPFRWQHLKDIVDNGHVDIFAVDMTTTFRVKEVVNNVERIVNRSLYLINPLASGLTLPRLSVLRAINPTANRYVASPDNSRDKVYYSSGRGGRGVLGSNSLSHELFGHLWLSMKGVPWQHGSQLTSAQGITDPMGRPYQGSVTDYIDHYVGASGTALQSPTQGVSPGQQTDILRWFLGHGAAGLTRLPGNRFDVSNDFGQHWERLSGNYDILKFHHEREVEPPSTSATTVTTAAGVRAWLVRWFNNLSADQKWVFRNFLSRLTIGWSAPQSRRTGLALDLRGMI